MWIDVVTARMTDGTCRHFPGVIVVKDFAGLQRLPVSSGLELDVPFGGHFMTTLPILANRSWCILVGGDQQHVDRKAISDGEMSEFAPPGA